MLSQIFLLVRSFLGKLWPKETDWRAAEDAGTLQGTLEQVCDHVQEVTDWKSMFIGAPCFIFN